LVNVTYLPSSEPYDSVGAITGMAMAKSRMSERIFLLIA